MIKTSYLTKSFGDFRAVDDLSCEIGQGECVGLLGLNGAGKTTLLRLLTCQLAPTSGSAAIDGLDVVERSYEVRKRIGFLPEVPPVYGEMTVGHYLAYAARLRQVPAMDVDVRVAEVARRCQIHSVLGHRIDILSAGYKKRVGIAQAIVHRPQVVVLDEPFADLDPAQIVEMRALIRELRGKHTVLLSSHILEQISQTCDRIMVMNRGRISFQGTEEELVKAMHVKARLRLQVTGERKQIESIVRGVDGVEAFEVTAQSDSDLGLLVSTSRDVRSALAAAVVQAGLSLLELSPARDDLEALFLKLTETREE